ncbi:MAG: ribonuclease H-like YkuK family protein [Nanoarchaeota archaeon]
MNKELSFKKFDGSKVENIDSYVKDWIRKHPNGNVTIGCDSQTHPRYVKYAITIVMHDVDENGIGHGAHVIYATVKDTNKNLKKDTYSKLWAEAEYTIMAAKMLESCEKNIKIHLDYNSKEGEYSNALYQSGIGYIKGMGFEAFGKPYSWAASHVADGLCKSASK